MIIVLQKTFILLLAAEHLGFLVLEMFLWRKELGRRIFRMNAEKAEITAVLAANQGLYNGFLAAGFIWALVRPDEIFGQQIGIFFSACALVAGVYGAFTVNRRIFFVQGLPALAALILCFL